MLKKFWNISHKITNKSRKNENLAPVRFVIEFSQSFLIPCSTLNIFSHLITKNFWVLGYTSQKIWKTFPQMTILKGKKNSKKIQKVFEKKFFIFLSKHIFFFLKFFLWGNNFLIQDLSSIHSNKKDSKSFYNCINGLKINNILG